jgi:type IV secretory pathway VirB10-like protein
MDWIFDNFQVVAMIAIVVISLAKRYLDSKRESSEEETETPDEDWTPPPPRRQSVPPPLGRTSVPPPMAGPMPPQRSAQRSAAQPPLSASMTEAASALQRQQEMMDRLQSAKEAKAQRAKAAGTSHRSPVKASKTVLVPVAGSLTGILRNRNEIRRAVILREVLGPPLGMR